MTIENNNNNNYENEYDNNNEGHKPVKTIILTDRQSLILETMITQRTTRQALEFLKENGYSISERTLRREKQII